MRRNTAPGLDDVIRFIYAAELPAIRDITEVIRARHKQLNDDAIGNLHFGDRVGFDAKRRGVIRGKIVEIRRKRVVVLDEVTGMRWRVSASLCTKLEPLPTEKKKRSRS